MRFFDADQFGQAVKEADVSGGQVTAGHQVVKNAADVDHHFAGRLLLVPVSRKLAHQGVHHFGGCGRREQGMEKSITNRKASNRSLRCTTRHLHMSFLSLACRDIFRRKPVRERSSRSLLVRRRSRITGSMRSCSRATRLSTDAHCRTQRSGGVCSSPQPVGIRWLDAPRSCLHACLRR